ncbi:MAG: glycosyl transferase 2 [Candidatus Peregrinibacteria bacterium GW2011_GWC2_33_13]|nr:MAG: glycosyl transferase 2 [Candidatus Peregrinibacteria bacterium GW2011_GWC2_33_13]
MTISVVINTLNAEKYLEGCLESVKNFDEIIICDMYSTDKTTEIAQKFDCKIVYHEKIGYVEPARNFAISQAARDWIFVVDADEIIPEKLVEFLKNFAQEQEKNNFQYTTVAIPRKNWFFGKFVNGDWAIDRPIRFFKKGSVNWKDEIHLFPKVDGQIFEIPMENEELTMIHYQCASISDLVNKANIYTNFEVKKWIDSYYNFSILSLIFEPFGVFLRMYFRQGGYKDGIHGFILALIRGYLYRFLIIVKIWEYNSRNNAGK